MKKLFLIGLLAFASCSKDEPARCSCVKITYKFQPAFYGPDGKVLVPDKYVEVDRYYGDFDCSQQTSAYISMGNSLYYRIKCN